jgi:hypothetical protein
MAHETLQAIVGTAIVDSRFRSRLLARAPEALHGFELTAEESEAISAIRAKTFRGFVSELHGWISRNESTMNVRAANY